MTFAVQTVRLVVNDSAVVLETGRDFHPSDTLASVLRDRLGYTGLKVACDEGACGVQRQVEMARAVALGPDLLLLDEPAAGTNEVESVRLIESIRKIRDVEKCAILLIDHDLPFVLNLCERLYVLDAGRVIAEGSPQEIQANNKVKEAYLGTRTAVRHRDMQSGH